MDNRRKRAFWAVLIVTGTCLSVAALVFLLVLHVHKRPLIITGAIIQQDVDPHKQAPIEKAVVTVTNGQASATGRSDFSGYFHITLLPSFQKGQFVTLEFRHPGYWPLDLTEPLAGTLVVARMRSIHPTTVVDMKRPQVPVSNISIRYSVRTKTEPNIGTAVKMFEIKNTPNILCNHGSPCSPNGKWKASMATASLDAGQNNILTNARVTCIAGPCPFTKITTNHLAKGGQTMTVSVLDWSATTTFLMEAEISHPQVSDVVRNLYPVILGRSMNFTVPAAAEGVTLEADVAEKDIIFPLGPDAILPWASCETKTETEQTRSYRCQLKPTFKFQ